MSTRTWRPSTSMPFILAIAAEARSGEEKVTKPKPLRVQTMKRHEDEGHNAKSARSCQHMRQHACGRTFKNGMNKQARQHTRTPTTNKCYAKKHTGCGQSRGQG